MNVKEKLVDLILNADSDKNLVWYDLYDLTREGNGCAEYFADYLIANGVTAQEFGEVYLELPKQFCPIYGRRLPQSPKGE